MWLSDGVSKLPQYFWNLFAGPTDNFYETTLAEGPKHDAKTVLKNISALY